MITVLIGANEPDIRMLLRMLFRRAGYQRVTVVDCAGTLGAAFGTAPALIMLQAPGQQGLDLCSALRANPRTAAIPIMVMATGLHPDAATTRRAGASDYIVAPFGNTDLIHRARILLNLGSDPWSNLAGPG